MPLPITHYIIIDDGRNDDIWFRDPDDDEGDMPPNAENDPMAVEEIAENEPMPEQEVAEEIEIMAALVSSYDTAEEEIALEALLDGYT